MKRKESQYLGIGLIISACILVVIFIGACIKKKSLLAALAAVAAANVGAGYYLLRRAQKKNNGYAFDFFDEDNYEIFDDEEAKRADSHIHATYHKRRRSDSEGRAAKPTYEIPVDEDATEEDFVR